jgi:hypothetical protein
MLVIISLDIIINMKNKKKNMYIYLQKIYNLSKKIFIFFTQI